MLPGPAAVSTAGSVCSSFQSEVQHAFVCPLLVVAAATVSVKRGSYTHAKTWENKMSSAVVKEMQYRDSNKQKQTEVYLELSERVLDDLNCFVQLFLLCVYSRK